MAEQKKKKLKKKADKKQATKIILSTDEEIDEEEDLDEDEEDAGGIYLEKEDVLVIYKALKHYKPDFSVVLFRPHFMLVSGDHLMKMHTNQWLLTPLSPPDIPWRATDQGAPHGA